MRLTRREALVGAAAGVLSLHAPSASGMPIDARPNPPMGRGLDLTPGGVRAPGSKNDYTVLRTQPWAQELLAVTTHVRLWADWPTFQPDGTIGITDPANPGLALLRSLDAQIDAAVKDGLRPILIPWRYPVWVNQNRAADGRKSPEWKLPPGGHGPDGEWGRWTRTLWERYAGQIACFEVINEPNLQMWPQQGIAAQVAEMITTTDLIARDYDRAAICLAPSISDAESDRPLKITEQRPFTDELLAELDRRGFAGGDHWIWSFHNYNDCELGGERVSAMRDRLRGSWRGRRADDGAPVVYSTEGGVRLTGVERRRSVAYSQQRRRVEQAALLADAVARYRKIAGVQLFTQYTAYADPNYDCGLAEPDGTPRPALRAWIDS